MLAMLIGCGLRRGELLALRVDSIQLREEHWVIADLLGKAGLIRTVPIPVWVKAAIDEWRNAGGITEGALFRSINKTGRVWGTGMTPKVLWEIVREAASRAGIEKLAPHDLRRSCARLCHLAGGELDQIQRVVREVDAAVPVVRLRDMDSVFAESIRRPRLLAQLLGAFAGLALLLAAIGTYGVLSYMVTERRREIGIRVALGAARADVLTQILKQGLQVTALGVSIGLAGALAVNRLIASLLFGVQPTDTVTIAFVIATITAVAVVASWLPAWRASRLDPNVVLRDE